MSVFLDTNVLIYAVFDAAKSRDKHRRARELMRRRSGVLSLQVLNEFVFQSTRPTRAVSLTAEQAFAFVEPLRRWRIVPLDLNVYDSACDVRRRTNYDWWDCLIVAAAITAGCDTLYTEDIQHGRVIEGVRIENPFRDMA